MMQVSTAQRHIRVGQHCRCNHEHLICLPALLYDMPRVSRCCWVFGCACSMVSCEGTPSGQKTHVLSWPGRTYHQTKPVLIIANIVLSGWTAYSVGVPTGKPNCAYVSIIHSAYVKGRSCRQTKYPPGNKCKYRIICLGDVLCQMAC